MNALPRLPAAALVALLWLIPSGIGAAAPENGSGSAERSATDPRAPREGWHPAIRGAFNFAFSFSDGVVGVTDGVGLSLGLELDAEVVWRRGPHEWASRLYLGHTQTKSPSLKQFVKSVDRLFLQTTYYFRLPEQRWLGVFALLRVNSELFPGSLLRSKTLTLIKQHTDGTVSEEELPAQRPFRLTDAFLPLVFKQFVGLLLLPLDWRELRITGRLGVSAWEAWTGKGYIADDNVETEDRYELRQLQDFQQAGPELHLGLRGTAVRKILSYELQAELQIPISTDVRTALYGADLVNVELRLNLGIKIAEWLSLGYSLIAVRTPLILPSWQVVNNVMLSFTASWIR